MVKKPTGFMSSSKCVCDELNKKCRNDHTHIPLMGGRAAGAAIYPKELCEAICRGIVRQKQEDGKMKVITGAMSSLQLKAFTQEICAIQECDSLDVEKALDAAGEKDVLRPNSEFPDFLSTYDETAW